MPRRDSTPQLTKRAAADRRVRPRNQGDRHKQMILHQISCNKLESVMEMQSVLYAVR